MTLFKKLLSFSAFLAMAISLFFGCKKFATIDQADLISTATAASVSGFVTDENNSPVEGASVKIGAKTTNTDQFGYFEIKNAEVIRNAAFVTISKNGYFKGIKTFIAADGKSAFFRIKLIPKKTSGTVSATAGGTVTLSNGLAVTLPANAVVNAATNAAYSGTVSVSAFYIDPTSPELEQIMPGDLRGIDKSNAIKVLSSYGMAIVELNGSGGELLQLSLGKKSALTIPVPVSITASAPASIPLWYFDETNGLWKEEGSAFKTGNTYIGEVTHFTPWNADMPQSGALVTGTLLMGSGSAQTFTTGQPLAFTRVKLTAVNNPANTRYTITDANGYFITDASSNTQYLMEVFTDCSTAAYSQYITTGNSLLSLGTITVISNGIPVSVTGTITDCNNNPLSSGFVYIFKNGHYIIAQANSSGNFTYNFYLCNGVTSTNIIVIGVNPALSQQGDPSIFTVSGNNNPIGNISACGSPTSEYFNSTVNATSYNQPTPPFYIYHSLKPDPVYTTTGYVYSQLLLSAPPVPTSLNYVQANISVGSSQLLTQFHIAGLPNFSITSPVYVRITEYGSVGQFISGNFSGALTVSGTLANVTCHFRVRRQI